MNEWIPFDTMAELVTVFIQINRVRWRRAKTNAVITAATAAASCSGSSRLFYYRFWYINYVIHNYIRIYRRTISTEFSHSHSMCGAHLHRPHAQTDTTHSAQVRIQTLCSGLCCLWYNFVFCSRPRAHTHTLVYTLMELNGSFRAFAILFLLVGASWKCVLVSTRAFDQVCPPVSMVYDVFGKIKPHMRLSIYIVLLFLLLSNGIRM